MGMEKKMSDERRIMHYSSTHSILLLGEGDFSFAVSLAEAFGNATNMVATSLDSRSSVLRKYDRGEKNLKTLEEYGCTILHEVDVHSLDQHRCLMSRRFDMIVFNFPHAGYYYSWPVAESSELQIRQHRELVRGFLKNARQLLSVGGEIHVTHKTAYPYCKWEVVELAEEAGLVLLEEAEFSKEDYPGYENKRAYGLNPNGNFPVGCSSTFKFFERECLLGFSLF